MKAIIRIRLRLFLLNLIFELIVNSIILIAAWFSNKIIETLFFYIVWNALRYFVPKVFHVKLKSPMMSIIGCGICSIACYIIAQQFILPIQTSIFSSVLIGMSIHYILYRIADYRDLLNDKNKKIVDIYKMTESELRSYCYSKGLSEMIVDTLVLRVIHNYKWCEIARERNYTKEGIRYHKERIEKQLNMKF